MKRLAPLFALALVVGACAAPPSTLTPSDDGEEGDAYEPFDELGKADGPSLSRGPVKFTRACERGDTLTIAAVGDVLLHGPLQKQAVASTDRFRSLWRDVEDLLGAADVTYANLEGPVAQGVNASGSSVRDPGFKFDEVVYSSYPQFNYHPYLIDDLLASGVDVVSTANNHSLDRRGLGVDRTLDALEAAGLPYTGTRRRDDTSSPWHTLTTHKGFTLAWLACTYATNGIPDTREQVLDCFEDQEALAAMVKDLAKRPGVDAVIVTPHWGVEYSANPGWDQSRLAHKLLDAGATAIIGSHPHVTQPWEKYVTADGRETFVLYSLGNFVSGQTSLARKSTLMLYLGLKRGADGRTFVAGVRYLPMYMDLSDGVRGVRAIDREGGASDSRAMTVKMFGTWNLAAPTLPIPTAPECDPDWTPPTR
jgi:poly-gamma-glutamate synthesis protein (capsule biosynthesis protein)